MPIIKPYNPWENGDPFGNTERFQNSDGFKLMQYEGTAGGNAQKRLRSVCALLFLEDLHAKQI